MTEDVFLSPKKKGKIAVFISGRGSNFRAIHDSILAGKMNCEIALVFSNKEDAPGLKTAQDRNLETLFLDPKAYSSREDYEKEIIKELSKRDVDLICLAGYMKILGPSLCREFKNAIINIHQHFFLLFLACMFKRKLLIGESDIQELLSTLFPRMWTWAQSSFRQ